VYREAVIIVHVSCMEPARLRNKTYMYRGTQLEYVATILDRVTCSAGIMLVSLSSVHVKVQSMFDMSQKVPVDRNCGSFRYIGYSFNLDSLQAA